MVRKLILAFGLATLTLPVTCVNVPSRASVDR